MNLKELEYFLVIEKERNLMRASEKLLISQPALSKFLSNLEKSYRTQFFIRTHNRLELTRTGAIYLESAKEIMNIAHRTDQMIEDEKSEGNYTISIGLTGERSQRFLGKILPLIYQKNPNLHCNAVEAPIIDLQKKLKSNEIDFAFYALAEPDPELVEPVVQSDQLIIAIPKGHRLFEEASDNPKGELKKVQLSDLKDDSFVLLRKETATRKIIDRYAREEKLILNEAIETKGNYSSMLFVDSGLATGFCYRNYNYKSDKIRYLGLTRPLFAQIVVAYKKNNYLSRPLRKFLQIATENGQLY